MAFDYFFLFSTFVVIFCSLVYILAYREQKKHYKEEKISYPGMSIIVPMWNEGETIAHTLESLLAMGEAYHGSMEVLVIDDNSTDNSFKIVEEYTRKYDFIRLYMKDKNLSQGKSESLNQGIKLARYDYVGCVDADSYPDAEALNHVAEDFSDPEVGAVTSKLVVRKPKKIVEWFQHIEYIYSNFILMAFDAMDAVYITRGPLSMYKKHIMEEIGGFLPADMTPTEDMEITFRIRKAGYRIRGSRKAKVFTSVMPTWKDLFWQRMRWNRGTLINFWMHRDMFMDPKYGMFSMFIYPTATLMIAMVAFIIVYLLYMTSIFLAQQGTQLYWIFITGQYPEFSQLVDSVANNPVLLSLHHLLLFVAVLGTFILVNGFGFRESRERLSMRYVFYLGLTPFIYNPVMIFFWASALVLQTTKYSVRWR